MLDNSQILQTTEYRFRSLVEGYYAPYTIFYGPSGCGKSALLCQIADMVAQKFEAVRIYPIHAKSFTAEMAAILGGNLEDMTANFVALGKQAKAENAFVAIFIDDLHKVSHDELSALMQALHRGNQLDLPIAFYGTGLPEILKKVGDTKPYGERLFAFVKLGSRRIAITKKQSKHGCKCTKKQGGWMMRTNVETFTTFADYISDETKVSKSEKAQAELEAARIGKRIEARETKRGLKDKGEVIR